RGFDARHDGRRLPGMGDPHEAVRRPQQRLGAGGRIVLAAVVHDHHLYVERLAVAPGEDVAEPAGSEGRGLVVGGEHDGEPGRHGRTIRQALHTPNPGTGATPRYAPPSSRPKAAPSRISPA